MTDVTVPEVVLSREEITVSGCTVLVADKKEELCTVLPDSVTLPEETAVVAMVAAVVPEAAVVAVDPEANVPAEGASVTAFCCCSVAIASVWGGSVTGCAIGWRLSSTRSGEHPLHIL